MQLPYKCFNLITFPWFFSCPLDVHILLKISNLLLCMCMVRGFSFWLSTVGINIVLILARSNIPFVRLDGTLSQQQRERVIKQFSEDDTILVCGSACPFLPFLNDFIFSTSVRAVVVDGLVESCVYHLNGGCLFRYY